MKTAISLIEEYLSKVAEASKNGNRLKALELRKEFTLQVKNLPLSIEEIEIALKNIAKDPCMKHSNLWLIIALGNLSSTYIELLCNILDQYNTCIWYEGIIYILSELKDDRAVPFLEKAIYYNFPNDEWNNVAIESLKALSSIGTTNAIAVIKKAMLSPYDNVRDEAIYRLEQLNRK